MPIFDFRCKQCGTTFEELLRSAADDAAIVCPGCGSGESERLIGAPNVLGSSGGVGGGGCAAPPGGGFT